MIRIEELRVGNIVNSPNGKIEIDRIFPTGYTKVKDFAVAGENNYHACPASELEPITLTKKNLIELGFSKSLSGSFDINISENKILNVFLSENNNAELSIEDDDGMIIILNRNIKLHQLQNLITDLK